MSPKERLDAAWAGLQKVHPNITEKDVPKSLGISIPVAESSLATRRLGQRLGVRDLIPPILLNAERDGQRF
jgi:hypothetical protein